MLPDTAYYSLILFSIYIIVLAGLSLYSYFHQNTDNYVIGGRNLGFFSTTCSMLAGQFNGGGVFIVISIGVTLGYAGLWFGVGFMIGYILLSLFAKRVHDEGVLYNDINVPDILKRRIGNKTQNFGSFIIIGKAILFGIAQLLIAGSVIAVLFGIHDWQGIWLTAFIILIYVVVGGYLTIIHTDVLQWLILSLIAIASFFVSDLAVINDVYNDAIKNISNFGIGAVLFMFMLIISNADAWQRILSAKSVRVARWSLLAAGALFAVFLFCLYSIVKTWGLTPEEDFKFITIFQDKLLPPLTLSIIGIFTLVSVMSTLDTQVQLFTSSLAKNVIKIDLENDQKKFVFVSRISTVLLLCFIAFCASWLDNTMEFVLKAFSFAYILAPIMVTAMLWGKDGSKFKDYTCITSLGIGLIVYIYMFFNGYFINMLNNCIPSMITACLCLIGYFTSKVLNKKTIV